MRSVHADERGATAVVLVFVLVVLLGMMALSIDGGLLWVKYRRIRAASDAAALSWARSCAANEAATAAGDAGVVAQANANGATLDPGFPVYGSGGCVPASGTVTVRYRAPQMMPFSGAVGLPNTRDAVARATAIWGGAGGSDDVIPLVIFPERLTSCGFNVSSGVYPAVGTECSFWFDDKAIGSASWGLLNLASWGTTSAPSGCSSEGGTDDIVGAIHGELDEPLYLSDPPPTYVCGKNGVPMEPVDNAIAQALADGRTKFVLPVTDDSLTVMTTKCTGKTCVDEPYKYAVVGFAFLEPVDLYKANKGTDAAGYAKCDSAHVGIEDSANAVCLVATWQGFSPDGLIPGGGPNFGLTAIGLQS